MLAEAKLKAEEEVTPHHNLVLFAGMALRDCL